MCVPANMKMLKIMINPFKCFANNDKHQSNQKLTDSYSTWFGLKLTKQKYTIACRSIIATKMVTHITI